MIARAIEIPCDDLLPLGRVEEVQIFGGGPLGTMRLGIGVDDGDRRLTYAAAGLRRARRADGELNDEPPAEMRTGEHDPVEFRIPGCKTMSEP